MLVLEGKSANYAKHAIPSIRKQRMLVTLTKSIAIPVKQYVQVAVALRQVAPPRVPVPGTGVFLPPGKHDDETSPKEKEKSETE